MNYTPQEERTMAEAISKAADGINEVRKVLTLIGDRLGAKFSESNLYIGTIAAFTAISTRREISWGGASQRMGFGNKSSNVSR